MRMQTIDGTNISSDNLIRIGFAIHGRGIVTKEFPRSTPVKSMCSGCEDDFYNGRNPYGVQECWAFKTAKVVNKVGYSSIHCENGPDTKMNATLNCWRGVRK